MNDFTGSSALEAIRPGANKLRVIDVVREAGFDVAKWDRPDGPASNNPKYCYEWCFAENGITLFFVWHDEMEVIEDAPALRLNMRDAIANAKGPRGRRARDFDDAMIDAYERAAPVKTAILERVSPDRPTPRARQLDTHYWLVTEYDYRSGGALLVRSADTISSGTDPSPNRTYTEGQRAERITPHRQRERRLRDAKIAEHRSTHDGRLPCEVPGCGFDFEAAYGPLGAGFAEVHHTTPLSRMKETGGVVGLEDLAVVCSNCHAMIHRGGRCRSLDEIGTDRS